MSKPSRFNGFFQLSNKKPRRRRNRLTGFAPEMLLLEIIISIFKLLFNEFGKQ